MSYISKLEDYIIPKDNGFIERTYSALNPFYKNRRSRERHEILESLKDENGNLRRAGTFRDIESRLGFKNLVITPRKHRRYSCSF